MVELYDPRVILVDVGAVPLFDINSVVPVWFKIPQFGATVNPVSVHTVGFAAVHEVITLPMLFETAPDVVVITALNNLEFATPVNVGVYKKLPVIARVAR